MQTMFTTTEIGYWLSVNDGDPRVSDLYSRHYTRRNYADSRRSLHGYRNRHLIMGPGEKLALLGADGRALFGWRKFRDGSGQEGINCAVFRNESDELSSDLIREADLLGWEKWSGERHYTYVNPRAVRSSNPGYCFIKAGWRKCGTTKWNKLLILERLPDDTNTSDTDKREKSCNRRPTRAAAP